jgi:3',5'-cyclic AMP phosphodiesterase CpdA
LSLDRRDFLRIAGVGAIVFASSLDGSHRSARAATSAPEDFFFVQLSDTHWGFSAPAVNPDFSGTLRKAVGAVNSLKEQPDFVVFTGDLTHVTDDDKERRARLAGFRDIVKELTVKDVRFMPGEHDAGLDEGEAYQEFFGKMHYAFDHKGVHFIVLDNVSDARSVIGEAQMEWLRADLASRGKDDPITVFTHRPLFDLYPDWDWHTRDGGQALDLLSRFSTVTVFFGHIHQEYQRKTGTANHHAAKGMMYPLPAPGSVPVKSPIPWDAAQPHRGLGFRGVSEPQLSISEYTVKGDKV